MTDEHKQMRTAFSEKLKAEVISKYFSNLGDSYNQTRLYQFFNERYGFFTMELNVNPKSLVINVAFSGRHDDVFQTIESSCDDLFRQVDAEVKFSQTGQDHRRVKVIRKWELYDRKCWQDGVEWVGKTGDQVIEILYPIVAEYAARNGIPMSTLYPAPTNDNVDDPFADVEAAMTDLESLEETERESIVQSRIGQGKFRELLINLWHQCPITGIKSPELLRASHIKPWRDATNEERLDPYNGLLLTPLYDHLFDKGFITFSDDGKLILSERLSQNDGKNLGINTQARIIGLSEETISFLSYHRENVFKKD